MSAPAKTKKKAPATNVEKIQALVRSDAAKEQFAMALPKHLTPDRFVRLLCTAITRVPKLADCTQTSLLQCFVDLSALGLEPDGRLAHLIPYGKTCTLVLDYKGLVQLVKRSGDVSSIHADIVCEGDEWEYNAGEIKVHRPDWESERNKDNCRLAYVIVRMKDGGEQCMVMTKPEIEAIRKASKMGNSGPWKDHWVEMAKKTVFRRCCKWMTLSPEVMDRVSVDDAHSFPQYAATHSVARALPSPADTFSPPPDSGQPDDGGGSVESSEWVAAINGCTSESQLMHIIEEQMTPEECEALKGVIDAKLAELGG